MRKTILPITILLMLAITTFGQQMERYQADSLLRRLNKATSDTSRIIILIRLAQFHIFKPGEYPIDLDSASACLAEARRLNRSARSQSLAGQLLLTESYLLREKGRKNEAIQKLDTAIQTLEPSDDKYYLGKALFELSGYYDYHDSADFAKKLDLVERSVTAFRQSKSILDQANALKMLGDLYHLHRDPTRATEVLNQALAVYNSINYKALQGVYDLLGGIYLEKDEFKQALYYELQALKAAQTSHDTTIQLCSINSSLAGLYSVSGKNDLSIKYFKNALDIAIKYDDRFAVALTVYNICTGYFYLERSGELLDFLSTIPSKFLHPAAPLEKAFFKLSYMEGYLGTRQYTTAGHYCDTLLKLVEEPGIPPGIKNITNRLAASYYMETKQLDKARLYLTQNKPITQNMAGKRARSLDERLWYKLDSAQGNYSAAFYHLHSYKTISDSLYNESRIRQIQQLEVEYETAQKEDSLKSKDQVISLLTQKNDLQQLSLRQARLIRNITIAGIVFSLIIMGLLYHQFRTNQRSNKIILEKNLQLKDMLAEKEWWLKEVHHRVKNNLHTIICLLESQAMYLEKDALQAIEKSQQRIYAMSLIHEKLYQDEELKSIDMSVYLDEFIGYLKKSFDVDNIAFALQVEPIHLNLSQAVPVALIINEAVTNSIKYAFPAAGTDDRISVSMYEKAETIHLIIGDNGTGFVPTEEIETKSLGLQLIKGLSKEIKGTVSIEGNKGTTISIRFKKATILTTTQFMQKELATYEA